MLHRQRRASGDRPAKVVPGPSGHRLVGNLHAYEADRLGFLQGAHAQYGPVVAFDKRTTSIADPGLIRDLLRSSSVGITHDVLLRPVSRRQSAEMSAVRRFLSPMTRRSKSCEIGPLVENELRLALAGLRAGASGRVPVTTPIDLLEPVISTAVNAYYFGQADAARIAPQVADILDDLSKLIGNPLAPPASWRTPLRRRMESKYDVLVAEVEKLLHDRCHGPRDDLVSEVAAQSSLDRHGSSLVAQMLVGSLLASQRVPAAAASWMLHLLATHVDSQRSIHVAGFRRHRAEETLRAVVFESLRLYPATWLLQRVAFETVKISGFSFPAGHTFLLSPYVVHRMPSIYERPAEFLPHRWEVGSQLRAHAGFLPFGDGLHTCPGRHLAVEALTTVAHVMCNEFTLIEEGHRVVADPRTTLLPVGSRLRLAESTAQLGEPEVEIG